MWLPKFFPTTQFHDSAASQKRLTPHTSNVLTPLLVEILFDVVGDLALLLELVHLVQDGLHAPGQPPASALTCLALSRTFSSMSHTSTFSFTIVINFEIDY